MRTFAIILGDNDFGSTFYAVLRTMRDVLTYHKRRMGPLGIETLTPEQTEVIIRNFAVPHYFAYQYSFNLRHYGGDPNLTQEQHLAHIADYFKKIKVLFDVAAETDIANEDHDSGAWYLELLSGTVASY